MPLLDDWFIRPLYFVESLDESSLQVLSQAIYSYFGKYFIGENVASKDLIRVTQSELVFLTINLIKTQHENLTSESLAVMDQAIEGIFFKNSDCDGSS